MLKNAIQTAAALALHGVPAIRAAVHGARLGAGARFAASTVEALGIRVQRTPVVALAPVELVADGLAKPALRVAGITRGGVQLQMSPTGALKATVNHNLVAAAARVSSRGALATIGRATAVGALGGAAIDAALAGVALVPALRTGALSGKDAAVHVAKHAARGAVAGAASVAAAGAVSAGVAAVGLTFAGAPVVVPLVAMVTVGTVVTRAIDKRFSTALRPVLGQRAD